MCSFSSAAVSGVWRIALLVFEWVSACLASISVCCGEKRRSTDTIEIWEHGTAVRVLRIVLEKRLLPTVGGEFSPNDCVALNDNNCIVVTINYLDYGVFIRRLCKLGMTDAAELVFGIAHNALVFLQNASYIALLKGFSRDKRIKEAVRMYFLLLQRDIALNICECNVLLNALFKEEQSEEVNKVIKSVIRKGFYPDPLAISSHISSQCSKGGWQEANELLWVMLERGVMPNGFACGSFIRHYCEDGGLDYALSLHEKLVKLGNVLNAPSYNILLDQLYNGGKLEEASEMFDHMRNKNVTSSASFITMISWFCWEKKFSEARKMHDEMLKKGLKPDEATYKRLISVFP
ncbi:pentatricopeptide repeat-containing protein At4g21170 [Amborella trichopoda]|uniref:pentatricopeptide repeat-containing protein At4g21170 n=1 Tax=Amborella trichopoda TaxID=13333 RepID=UPI0009BF697F|nr:pentatricopeptide repeat-containing protein At4g21170 [Amborella trichopoda]|eukprot:XP_020531287.1 pentatricopeptide repeat-containing protein At4g21170 [Amborella trichopoda]